MDLPLLNGDVLVAPVRLLNDGLSPAGGGVGHNGGLLVMNIGRLGHIGGGLVVGRNVSGLVGDGLDNGGLGNGMGMSLLANDSIESVDGISGVVHDTTGAIGLHQAVLALHNISVAHLMLALVVAGESVLNAVREAVLGVCVHFQFAVQDRLGQVRGHGGMGQQTSAGNGQDGEEGDKLGKGITITVR